MGISELVKELSFHENSFDPVFHYIQLKERFNQFWIV